MLSVIVSFIFSVSSARSCTAEAVLMFSLEHSSVIVTVNPPPDNMTFSSSVTSIAQSSSRLSVSFKSSFRYANAVSAPARAIHRQRIFSTEDKLMRLSRRLFWAPTARIAIITTSIHITPASTVPACLSRLSVIIRFIILYLYSRYPWCRYPGFHFRPDPTQNSRHPLHP